ncbi:MAG: hypothetical protein JWP35_2694 [Caulobacter sp.]|nr:hypothetical protein [Caulobacter sp.]
MRLQLASLIAAAGLTGFVANATAQEAAPPPPPPPPASTEAPAAPAAPAPQAAPAAPATAAPSDPTQAPAAAPTDATAQPAAPAEPPPPPTPVLPTSGDGYEVIQVLQTICEPGVKGGNVDALAKANGFKKGKLGWTKVLGAKPYSITVDFYSVANPTVCTLTLDYATGGAQTIIDGLTAWTYLHEPFMHLYRNDEYNTDLLRRTISWEHVGENGGSTGLVFVGEKKSDGSPVSKVGDRASLRFQIRNGG